MADENLQFGMKQGFQLSNPPKTYSTPPAPISGMSLFNNYSTPSVPEYKPADVPAPISTDGAGTMIGSLAGPIGTVVGSVIDAGVTLYGIHEQKKANEENRKQAERWAAIQNEIAKKENARQWKWLEEERDYGYANDFQKGIWNMMAMDVQMKDHLAQLYRRAA